MSHNLDERPRNAGRPRADYLRPAEARWLPALEQLGARRLRSHLRRAGVRATTAAAIVAFVEDHRDGAPDGLCQDTRAGYRRRLDALDPPVDPIRAVA